MAAGCGVDDAIGAPQPVAARRAGSAEGSTGVEATN